MSRDQIDFNLRQLAFLKDISLHEKDLVNTYKKYYKGYDSYSYYTCIKDMRNEKDEWSCVEGIYDLYESDMRRKKLEFTKVKIENNFFKKYILKYYYPTYTFYDKYWKKQ